MKFLGWFRALALTGLGAILFSLFAVNFFFTDFHGFL